MLSFHHNYLSCLWMTIGELQVHYSHLEKKKKRVGWRQTSISVLPLVWDPAVSSSLTVYGKQQQNNKLNSVNLYIQ